MRYLSRLAICAILALAGSGALSVASALSLSEKAELQAAMQRYVDRQSVDGRYLVLDHRTGEVRSLHAATAHPMIMTMGKHFVLCFDFRDDAGKAVDVDFYLARKGRSFTVFQSFVQGHDVLGKLMKAGKVARAE